MKCPLVLAALLLAHPLTAAPLLADANLAAWSLQTSPAAAISGVCHLKADGVLTVDGKPSGYFATTRSYKNYRLHVEWRWNGAPGNSGILLHISTGPLDRVWPRCFQVQMKHKSVGDLLPMAGAKFSETLTAGEKVPALVRRAPDSEKPPGEWNACDITSRGGAIEVAVNGVLQNRVSGCDPNAGSIGFQLEGAPFDLRALNITPLD